MKFDRTVTKRLLAMAVMSLVGCSGGGGGSSAPSAGPSAGPSSGPPPPPPPPSGDSVTLGLEWDEPTLNADGTRLGDLAQYRVWGSKDGGVFDLIARSVAPRTDVLIEPGSWVFYVTAFDFNGNESDPSNSLRAEVDPP